MNSPIKTLQSLEAEEQGLLAELAGLEIKLLELHDREWQIRTELAHIEIQKNRAPGL